MWDGNVLVRLCEIHLCVSYVCHWGRLIYSSGEISSASLKQKEAGHSCVIALATIAILIFGNIDAVKVRFGWQYSRDRSLSATTEELDHASFRRNTLRYDDVSSQLMFGSRSQKWPHPDTDARWLGSSVYQNWCQVYLSDPQLIRTDMFLFCFIKVWHHWGLCDQQKNNKDFIKQGNSIEH